MNRVLIFLIVVFSLGFGFAWLADRPGNLALTWEGYAYEIPLFAAAALAVALVVATMILWWLIVSIWRSPKTVSGYFRGRRRDKGFAALSSG
ncbi:MAG TPA: heme biosynthesis HemY N-terminal domain-containing protein, partial [Rhizobiaceae bacterium]|nr:heme biosynthesis HemY N-terminal domain-containing protein [Rhizobiaceae bacterium]